MQFAEHIFGIKTKGADDLDCALQVLDTFEDFLKSIGCPTRLSELDINDSLITRYAQDTLRIVHDEHGNLSGRSPMSKEDIVEVLRSAL